MTFSFASRRFEMSRAAGLPQHAVAQLEVEDTDSLIRLIYRSVDWPCHPPSAIEY